VIGIKHSNATLMPDCQAQH